MVLAHLYYSKKIGRISSAFNVFLKLLQFMASNDLSSRDQGLILFPKDGENGRSKVDPADFLEENGIVILSPFSAFNIAATVSASKYREFITRCNDILRFIDSDRDYIARKNIIDGIFKKEPLICQFDQIVKIRFRDYFSRRILNDLINRIYERMWNRTERLSFDLDNFRKILMIGIGLNNLSHVFIEKGPSIEEKAKSRRFRDLWGKHSAVRRYKDGSIVEAVDLRKLDCGGRSIFERIIRFAVSTTKCAVKMPFENFDNLVSEHKSTSLRAKRSFRKLVSHLKSDDNFRDKIHRVDLLHPLRRVDHTYFENHIKNDVWLYEPIPVQLVFMKTKFSDGFETPFAHSENSFILLKAIYLNLVKCLKVTEKSVLRVPEGVDVWTGSAVFRISAIFQSDESEDGQLERCHSFIERHSDGLKSFEKAVAVSKLWISMHGFNLEDTFVELLVLYCYKKSKHKEMQYFSPQRAFFCFLEVLHSHEWRKLPLLIIEDSIIHSIDELKKKVKSTDQDGRFLCFHIADYAGEHFYTQKMNKYDFVRLKSISKASLDFAERFLSKDATKLNLLTLFKSEPSHFDVRFRLNSLDAIKNCSALHDIEHNSSFAFSPLKKIFDLLSNRFAAILQLSLHSKSRFLLLKWNNSSEVGHIKRYVIDEISNELKEFFQSVELGEDD
ncbi:hypothetical protein MHBO_002238 [Bonamia ostreae]|uniref:Nucleolar protein 6 n=1 Tax=Bonamia ostreae TaxID=126728 RepID=A0ABV2ALP0_9EUKA